MKIALLCSGLGNVRRGHEVFARDLFNLLNNSIDITLFKGGGENSKNERVIDNIPRDSEYILDVHVLASSKWEHSVKEQERYRIEAETFAYAALKRLLEEGFDIIHCLEREVCNIIYDHRHFFHSIPKIVFSNGGAIPAIDLPRCDYVQEHTEHNLRYSAKNKAFMIPHGVDLNKFNPSIESDFRAQYGIPKDAFVVISVGTICYQHKRMDYVIKEIASLADIYLLIVGQECQDTPEIKAMGKQLMGDRIIFTSLSHDELPKAYAAANVFVLGSLFETFGIVYIEAMAMGLPVICTNHINQRLIVKEGIFIDMNQPSALANILSNLDLGKLAETGEKGRQIAMQLYDIKILKQKYEYQYQLIANTRIALPKYGYKNMILSNYRNIFRKMAKIIYGSAE